ncbi:MAG TPA: hypothetical protein VFU85_14030 [Nocardioides sp.]|nr:hypothetical protein [Nocardioides sp.]
MSEPTTTAKDEQGSGPVPGDVTTEPVATAAESHVAGRVGPPSIAQDSAADWHTPEGVEQIDPGAEAPAETPMLGGPVSVVEPDPAYFGAGPYGGDTPAEDAPGGVKATDRGNESGSESGGASSGAKSSSSGAKSSSSGAKSSSSSSS